MDISVTNRTSELLKIRFPKYQTAYSDADDVILQRLDVCPNARYTTLYSAVQVNQ